MMETNFLQVTLNRRDRHVLGCFISPPSSGSAFIPIIRCCFGFGESPKRDVKPTARD
jgi:hypothetical protein